MLEFLAEIMVNLLGEFLWAAFGWEQGRLGESPIERQQRHFWRWVGGIVLLLMVVAAVYGWSSRHL